MVLIEDINSYMNKQIEPVAVLDKLWNIPKGIVSVVAGTNAVGKSHFLLWNVLRWIEEYSVAYLSIKDPINIVEYRLQKLVRKRQIRINGDKEYVVPIPQSKPLAFEYFDNLSSPNLDSLYNVILSYVEQGYNIIAVDALNLFLEDEDNDKELLKFMFQLRKLCSQKNINVFLAYHIEKSKKEQTMSSKQDLMKLLRKTSALYFGAKYVWFLRRNAEDGSLIEAWNCKNSYLSDNRDYMFAHLLDYGVVKMSSMSFSAGEVKAYETGDFYEVEEDPDFTNYL